MVAECLGLDPFCTIVGFHDDILVNPVRAVAGLKVRRSPTPTFGRVLTGVWVDAVFVLARSAVPYANINRIVDRILERPFSWWATIGHSAKLSVLWSIWPPYYSTMHFLENGVLFELPYCTRRQMPSEPLW